MPRHSKNRRPQWGYPPQYMPPMVPMPMGGGMFPLPPPPLPLMAPPMMSFVPPPRAASAQADVAPPAQTDVSAVERACLPHFAAEREMNAARNPTDIVIIDLDRTLLPTPAMNADLIDKESRHVLESRLGPDSGWWQSPLVLDAAMQLGRWDASLLEIARAAALNPTALLVLTTYRPSKLEPEIRAALATQGIPTVDHFACSTDSQYSMGSKAKQHLLNVLLESYSSIQRAFVFDANGADQQAYDQAAHKAVKRGAYPAGTFRVLNLPTPILQLPPLQERELIETLIEDSKQPIDASVVTTNWVHHICDESRQRLVQCISTLPFYNMVSQIECTEIEIVAGKLPSELRLFVGMLGTRNDWTLTGYEVHGRIVSLYARSAVSTPLTDSFTAHGTRFKGARLSKQMEIPFTALSDGPEFMTSLYERRALRVKVSKG